MPRTLEGFFTANDFDVLRETLKRSLSTVLPERDHKELILDLIHAVKYDAAHRANSILAAEATKWERLYGRQKMGGVYFEPLPGYGKLPAEFEAALAFPRPIEEPK